MGRPRRKSGTVKRNVVWIDSASEYREVLDDTKPEMELGEVVHWVQDSAKTGEGHFEYGVKEADNG